MTADIFTKPLPRPQFERHVLGLGLAPSSDFTKDKFWKLNPSGIHAWIEGDEHR